MWFEEYEHEEFGEIVVAWDDDEPRRSHLVAISSFLWTPVEEVEACIKWARNLQDDYMTRGGDAGTDVPEPLPF